MSRFERSIEPIDFQLVQQNNNSSNVLSAIQRVEYKCQIINNILKTLLVQTFRSQQNNENSEYIYMFPIQENICLESFEVRYNDKIIKGIVKQKEDAQNEYQQNKNQGDFVSYAEIQKNQNGEYVEIIIGNLPPEIQVEIMISFSQQLQSIFNKYYIACIPIKYVEDETLAKLGKSFLTLDIFCTGKITYANSKGFPTEKTMVDDNTARFVLNQNSNQKDVNFQVIFSYEGMFDPQVIFGSSKIFNEDLVKRNLLPASHSAMISFIPNFNEEVAQEIDDVMRAALMNGDDILSDKFEQKLYFEMIDHLSSSKSEYIFLLDRSWSMIGEPIKKAIEALILFLKSLPSDSYFNVIGFGTVYQKVFPESKRYDSTTMNEAIKIISEQTADLGDTNIYEPLENIFIFQQRIKGYNKQIFLLTDGGVNDSLSVVDLIKKNNKFNRVHSIGFGLGADKFLIEQSSVAGKGIHKIIDLSSDLSEVVINILLNTISPTYDDFTVSYDKSIFNSTYPVSTDFPCVFKDEIINIHLFFQPLVDIQSLTDDQKIIQISYYDSHKKQNMKKQIRLEMSDCFTCNQDLQESVFKLGKQLYLNENLEKKQGGDELVQQAIDFQLITEKTALICVIEQLNDEQKIMYQNKKYQNVHDNENVHNNEIALCPCELPFYYDDVYKLEGLDQDDDDDEFLDYYYQHNAQYQNDNFKSQQCVSLSQKQNYQSDNTKQSCDFINLDFYNQSQDNQINENKMQSPESQQQQQIHQKRQDLNLYLENVLQFVDSEGVWKFDEFVIQSCSNITQYLFYEMIPYFNNYDAFMTTFVLCLLEVFFNEEKQKWILISKKSTSYVKQNMTQSNLFDLIKQKLTETLKI